MTEGSKNCEIGRITTTSSGVKKRLKGGECPGLWIYSKNSCLNGKKSIKVLARSTGYENDKCTSQNSRTNVPKEGGRE